MFLKNQSCIFIHVNTCTSVKKIDITFNKKTMKNSRILIFLFITAISSCASDDEMQQDDALLGVWELSSSNDYYYYRLAFLPDYSGYWEDMGFFPPPDYEYALGGAANFTWSTTDNRKTLIIPDMELNSPYSINAEGQLIINDLQKGLPFNKLDSSN